MVMLSNCVRQLHELVCKSRQVNRQTQGALIGAQTCRGAKKGENNYFSSFKIWRVQMRGLFVEIAASEQLVAFKVSSKCAQSANKICPIFRQIVKSAKASPWRERGISLNFDKQTTSRQCTLSNIEQTQLKLQHTVTVFVNSIKREFPVYTIVHTVWYTV